MVFVIIGLLLAALGGVSEEQSAWPVDIAIQESAPQYTGNPDSRMTVEDVLDKAEQVDVRRLLSVDVIVLGTVTETMSFLEGREPFTRVSIDVDDCLKGHCGSGVIDIIAPGGTVDGVTTETHASGPLWAGPFRSEPPVAGSRYLFLLRRDEKDPSVLRTGGNAFRYLIDDGLIARKGIPLETFVPLIGARLEPRRPCALFRISEAVVMGVVTDVNTCPRADPSCAPNFVSFEVEAVGKGKMVEGEAVRVELPYLRDRGYDFPRFRLGERDVVFLKKTTQGTWNLVDGWDAKLRVLEDGSFEGFRSVSELARLAEGH
mgnify:CR=1 FL=1